MFKWGLGNNTNNRAEALALLMRARITKKKEHKFSHNNWRLYILNRLDDTEEDV